MTKLYRNSAWNTLSVIVPAFIAMPSLGILARGLGPDVFGLYSLVFIVLGYSGIFDAGITRSVVYFVSRNRSSDNEVSDLISTACVFLFSFSLLIVAPLAYFMDDFVGSLSGYTQESQYQLIVGMRLVVLSIPLVLLNLVFQGYLEGRQKFFELSVFKMAINPLASLLPALSVLIYGTLTAAILSLLTAKLIALVLISLVYVRDLGQRKQSIGNVSLSSFDKIIRFGGWISLSNVLSPIMNTFDRFIVASIYGANATGMYSVAADAVSRFSIFPVAVAKVIFPIFSDSSKEPIHQEIRRQSIRMISLPMLAVTSFAIFYAEEIILMWFGSAYIGNTVLVFQVLLMGFFFNAIAQVPYGIIQASGNAKYTAMLHAAEVIPHLIFMYFMVSNYQIVGAALAISIRSVLDALLLFIIEKNTNAKSGI